MQPRETTERGDEASRLRHDTPERQDFDDLVPDGMDDEANVDPDGDPPAEETAMTLDDPAEFERSEVDRLEREGEALRGELDRARPLGE